MENEQQTQPNKQLIRIEDISKQVLDKLNLYEQDGSIKLPANYNAGNALKSAWLILQETKDRANRPVLTVCSKQSIARTLMDMVLQGLSASKKQCYFIAYGDQLQLQRSYFGTLSLAKNVTKGKLEDPVANIIYEGDDFAYEIKPETGRKRIIRHTQTIDNLLPEKIKGAYCVYIIDGVTDVEIMTIAQIRKAWQMGAGKGDTKAHNNFTDQMCKKTVISRACKIIINSSSDAWLDDTDPDVEHSTTETKAVKKEIVNQPNEQVNIEEIEYVEMDSAETSEEKRSQETVQEVNKNNPTTAPF